MFSGFKSRCMIFCSCINCTPLAISSHLMNIYAYHTFSFIFCVAVWVFIHLFMQTFSFHQIHNHIKGCFSFKNFIKTYKLLSFEFPHNLNFKMHRFCSFRTVIHIFFINTLSSVVLFICFVSY